MTTIHLELDAEQLDQIADRVALTLRRQGLAAVEGVMNIEQAAAYLDCAPQRLRDLAKARRVTSAKEGGRLVFRKEWLDELLDVRPAA